MRTVLYACTDLAYDQIFTPVTMTPGGTYGKAVRLWPVDRLETCI